MSITVVLHPAERFMNEFLFTSPRLYIRRRKTDTDTIKVHIEVFNEIAPFFDRLRDEWRREWEKEQEASVPPKPNGNCRHEFIDPKSSPGSWSRCIRCGDMAVKPGVDVHDIYKRREHLTQDDITMMVAELMNTRDRAHFAEEDNRGLAKEQLLMRKIVLAGLRGEPMDDLLVEYRRQIGTAHLERT